MVPRARHTGGTTASRVGRSARWLTLLAVACASLLAPLRARAETTVPLDLQVELLLKVVRFERGFARRSELGVTVLLVTRHGDPASERAAAQLTRGLRDARQIAGRPVRIIAHLYTSAAALKSATAGEGAQLVYLTPGLDADVADIASAMVGVPAITVSTDGDQVDRGIILGFALVSARPKIALNVGQAKRQGLDFNSDLFRLARVIP